MAIIEDIERRLLNWARWHAGELAGALGFATASLVEAGTGGSDGADGPVIPVMGLEASETNDAVRALPDELRCAVEQWYLKGGTVREKARRLGVHMETLKRRRDDAHRRLQAWLVDRHAQKRGGEALPMPGWQR